MSCKSKDRQYNGQIKRTKGQAMIYETLHTNLKIEHHETTKNQKLTQVLRKGKQFMLHIWHLSFKFFGIRNTFHLYSHSFI